MDLFIKSDKNWFVISMIYQTSLYDCSAHSSTITNKSHHDRRSTSSRSVTRRWCINRLVDRTVLWLCILQYIKHHGCHEFDKTPELWSGYLILYFPVSESFWQTHAKSQSFVQSSSGQDLATLSVLMSKCNNCISLH